MSANAPIPHGPAHWQPSLLHGWSRLEGIRSYLYLPGHRLESLDAALASAADAIVFDLEDLLPRPHKLTGRAAVSEALRSVRSKPCLARINDLDSQLHADDLHAVVQPGLTAIRLPKCEEPERIRHFARALDQARQEAGLVASIGLQLMIESARGLQQLDALLRASHLVWSVGIGEGDLGDDLHVSSDIGFAYARGRVVSACRAAGLPGPVQVTFPPDGSPRALQDSSTLCQMLGFSGRSVLKEEHAAAVNRIYQPHGH